MRLRCISRAVASAFGLTLAAASAQHLPPSAVADRVLPLEVIVNGAKTGSWVLVERGGVLYAPADAFEEWRVQVDPSVPTLEFKGQIYRALSAIPGFKSKIDTATQTVELLFAPQVFSKLRLERELRKRTPQSEVLPSLVLNYDASYTQSKPRDGAGSQELGVLTELALSTRLGVITSTAVGQNLTKSSRRIVRLETTYTRDFPDSNVTLRAGDTVTSPAMWGREVYFGGVRLGTNFSLTPGLVTNPLPALAGQSTAPSTVELYINDVLRQVSNVPTGPFVIDNFPQLGGAGEARLVVRDLLGRETVIVQPFFTSSMLLSPGLDDWSVEAGKVRRNLGLDNNDYSRGFLAASWRHGRNPGLTLESRAEVTGRLGLLGFGALSMLPFEILGRAAFAVSKDDLLGSGHLELLGLETQRVNWSASIQGIRSSPRFRELGQDLVGARRSEVAGSFQYGTVGGSTLGLGFASIERFVGPRVSTVSGNYTMRVGLRGSVTLFASRAIGGDSGSSVALTYTLPLENGIATSATAGHRRGETDAYVTAVRNPGSATDFGWRVLAGEQSGVRRAEGGLYYQGQYGALSGDVAVGQDVTSVRAGASGGLVYTSGSVFVTRRVDESFAVAEVEGYGDVPVGVGGNLLSRTNSKGVALIPRLLPYIENSIRLDPKNLPINAEIDSIEHIVVPAWRSGVKVPFPVRSGRGALLKIFLDDGQEAPPGALVNITGDKEEFYVARRGEAFVTGLKPDSRVVLRWKGRACSLTFVLPPDDPDAIAKVGPVACKGVAR